MGPKKMNYFGIVFGTLMLILPFLGPWWIIKVGDGAFDFSTSPFELNITFAGQPVASPLIELFLLATKLTFWIGGTFILLSSISPRSWWAEKLFRFGAMKPLWAVVGLVITIVGGTFIVNHILPAIISSIAGTSLIQSMPLPYFQGSTTAVFQLGPAILRAPVTISLGAGFWIAIVTAGIGIAGRLYQKRMAPKEKL